MSCNYADGLSPYHDKGQLGLDEKFDSKSVVNAKVTLLAKWINEAKHVVIHTGAGISTSAGIPDFRGPKGVWTLQAKGQKPDISTDFNEAIPTITHMAITKLVEKSKVKYVISQNIDGLHLRSNLQRKYLSELHGNMFIEQCNTCNRQFVRNSAAPTVGQKTLNKACPTIKGNGRPCRGRLHDTILDWEHSLPENDLGMADFHSCLADLSVCLGTTMQIVPSGNLPLYTKKHGGKLVICNLQPTKHDRKADLIIHSYVDEIMTLLMKTLNVKIPKYSAKNDPTKSLTLSSDKYFEWTISDLAVSKMRKIYEEKCGSKEAKKRLNMIDDDDLPLRITRTLKKSKGEEKSTDEDLEVVDVIVKPKKSSPSKEKRAQKRRTSSPPAYNSTITVKKVNPSKKGKYETEKITIKKNVTPTKTKYEIVQPKSERSKKVKCEIVYSTNDELCDDLEMICESGSEDSQNCFTYNYRRYLHEEKTFKQEEEEKKNIIKVEETKSADSSEAELANKVKEEKNDNENVENKEVEKKKDTDDEKKDTDDEKKDKVEENVEEGKNAKENESEKADGKVEKEEESKDSNEKQENVDVEEPEKSEKGVNKDKAESIEDIAEVEKEPVSETEKVESEKQKEEDSNSNINEILKAEEEKEKTEATVNTESTENDEKMDDESQKDADNEEAENVKQMDADQIDNQEKEDITEDIEEELNELVQSPAEKEENEPDASEKDEEMESEPVNDDESTKEPEEVADKDEENIEKDQVERDESVNDNEVVKNDALTTNEVMNNEPVTVNEVTNNESVNDNELLRNEAVSDDKIEGVESFGSSSQQLENEGSQFEEKSDNLYSLPNSETRFESLPASNIENTIQTSLDQLVSQGTEQFSTSLVSNTADRFLSQALTDNYNHFYNSSFTTGDNNPPDLDYVHNSYYSNY